jgi:hypothetical protein
LGSNLAYFRDQKVVAQETVFCTTKQSGYQGSDETSRTCGHLSVVCTCPVDPSRHMIVSPRLRSGAAPITLKPSRGHVHGSASSSPPASNQNLPCAASLRSRCFRSQVHSEPNNRACATRVSLPIETQRNQPAADEAGNEPPQARIVRRGRAVEGVFGNGVRDWPGTARGRVRLGTNRILRGGRL